jgi:MFS family permease
LGTAIAGFCGFLDIYAPQSLLPALQTVFHAPEWQVSLTIGATTIAVALAAPFIGLLADATGRKRVIVTSILCLAIPTLMAGFAQTLNQLILWRFAQGIFLPGIVAATMAYIAEECRDHLGSTMAGYVSGTVVGGFMSRFLAGVIAAHWGWRSAFFVLGALTLLGGLITWISLPRARHFVRQTNVLASIKAFAGHLRNSRLVATYAVGFNVLFSLVGTFTWISFYLAAPPFHLGTAALGSIFFVYLIGAIITPLAGRWIDRIGYRITLAIAVTASSLGVLLTLIPLLPVVVAGLAICCSGVFICQSASSSHIGVAARGARSSAAGLFVALYYAGGSAGSVVPGLLWHVGGWPACVILIVFMQLITATLALIFWTTPSRPTSDAVNLPQP